MRAQSLLLAFLLKKGAAQENQTNTIVANQLTAWKECSLNEDREWSICLAPTGWGALWYCPAWDESVHPIHNPAKLDDIYWFGLQMSFLPCFECPSEDSAYGSDCKSTMNTIVDRYNITEDVIGESAHYTVIEEGLKYCTELCEAGTNGNVCSAKNKCTAGSHFCHYSDDDDASGICQDCPEDINDCYKDGFLTSLRSQTECFRCRLGCYDVGDSSLAVDGEDVESSPIGLANNEQTMSASGPLVDCSDLILAGVDICLGAKGSVCLVKVYTFDLYYFVLSEKAETNGCVAIIAFDESTEGMGGHHSYDSLRIPFVFVGTDDGDRLRNENLGAIANVGMEVWGSACYPSWDTTICTDFIPCEESNTFCDFSSVVEDGEYLEGFCEACPTNEAGEPDPTGCFFERGMANSPKKQKEVENCARSCNADLSFSGCKLCPNDISAFDFGVDTKADKCEFCPKNDVLYPDRHVPLFGENITCWNMQAFFERLDVKKDSQNCKLAQSYNYICGCEGPGYAGANTQAKQNALVWAPRVTAILSGLGSLFVLFDALKTRSRRSSLFHQLMAQMSVFDIIGSIAYAFTSLPIPPDYYFQGANGNDATCTAQGFFIQVGTVACYTNVSLAFYYFFVIKKGWSETRLKKVRYWFFICPLLVGMAFAFAGIPFYDNMVLWCNNAAPWWPDIPVAVAILIATLVMGSVCQDVYQKGKASKRWQQQGTISSSNSNSLSNKVFWQSFWYLMAFYMTWSPYLALQYFWAAGKGFGNYGFIVYAGTVVPLQGVWNFFVYARNRQLKHFREQVSVALSRASSKISSRVSFSMKEKRPSVTQATQNHVSTIQSSVQKNPTLLDGSEKEDTQAPPDTKDVESSTI